MKCFDSNYINTGNDFILVEADEYDRSFLNLNPNYAVITSIESDHLDIYGDFKSLIESFQSFTNNVKDVLDEIPIHIYKNLIKGAYNRSEKYVKRPSTRKRKPKKYLD